MLLWAHVVVLPLIGLFRGQSGPALVGVAFVALFGAGAMVPRFSMGTRSALATLGLMSSSALLVLISDGVTEMHFHFFVMIAVITLYQAWPPFLLSVVFVLLHHGVFGAIAPMSVYGSHSAMDAPWAWTLVHAGFVLAESVALLVYWRVTEDALDGERAARAQLEKAHDDLAQAQELAAMGSWDWDITSDVVTWSDQLYAIAGMDRTTFSPTVESFMGLVHTDDHARVAELISTAVETRTKLEYECRLGGPDGAIRTVHALGEWVTDESGMATRMFGTLHDVTERKRLQDEIEHLAFHDPLTGLANRRLFLDRLGHALAVTHRSGLSCAVLFMDLDGFKKINDTFGHSAGDEVLCEVARRLTAAARNMDTIARLGGDEFALLCEGIDLETANKVADRIDARLHRPVELQGINISLRGSIGIALAEGSLSTEEILRNADTAMYSVKSAGKALTQGLSADN